METSPPAARLTVRLPPRPTRLAGCTLALLVASMLGACDDSLPCSPGDSCSGGAGGRAASSAGAGASGACAGDSVCVPLGSPRGGGGCLPPASAACCGGSGGGWGPCGGPPRLAGLALVAPSNTCEIVPTTTRLLLNTRIGLPMLRPLLRSEIGEAALRRYWHCQGKLTRDVVAQYTAPLHCEGWDRALWEVARLSREIPSGEVASLLISASSAPALVMVGANDRMVLAERVEHLAEELGPSARCMILPECGHLPHEESPAALLALLGPFCADTLGLDPACAAAAMQMSISAAAGGSGCGAGMLGLGAGMEDGLCGAAGGNVGGDGCAGGGGSAGGGSATAPAAYPRPRGALSSQGAASASQGGPDGDGAAGNSSATASGFSRRGGASSTSVSVSASPDAPPGACADLLCWPSDPGSAVQPGGAGATGQQQAQHAAAGAAAAAASEELLGDWDLGAEQPECRAAPRGAGAAAGAAAVSSLER